MAMHETTAGPGKLDQDDTGCTENVREGCEAQLEKIAPSGRTLSYIRDQH